MRYEPYRSDIHGKLLKQGVQSAEWKQLFEHALKGPQYVEGVSRQAVYQRIRKFGLQGKLRVLSIAQSDALVVAPAREE